MRVAVALIIFNRPALAGEAGKGAAILAAVGSPVRMVKMHHKLSDVEQVRFQGAGQ